MSIVHHLSRVFSEVTKLSVGVCCEFLSIVDHVFDCPIGSISSCVININGLELNVERRDVSSVETDDVLTNFVDWG